MDGHTLTEASALQISCMMLIAMLLRPTASTVAVSYTHLYRCPKCRQKLRVPRGRGRIQISCPRCGTQFIKKS